MTTTPWQEVRALAEKATLPWSVDDSERSEIGVVDAEGERVLTMLWNETQAQRDAALIVAAVNLIRDPAFIGMMEDAARYRHLRDNLPPGTFGDFEVSSAESWDRAIDAALSAQLAGDGERGK